jgi:hypothetical protein
MLALGGLALLLIQGPHAFLKCQERLVDLRALLLPLLVVALAVLGPLAASQINEQQLPRLLRALLVHLYLAYGVTAARRVVGLGGVRRAHTVPEGDQVQYLLLALHELLLEALNLNFLALVLQNLQLLVIVQQVEELAPVDLVHRDGHREVSLVVLEVGDAPVEQVPDR